jgi:hypothetical protein
MSQNPWNQYGTVIATKLLRKTDNNPEHVPVRRGNFIEITESGSNEENQSTLSHGFIHPNDGHWNDGVPSASTTHHSSSSQRIKSRHGLPGELLWE